MYKVFQTSWKSHQFVLPASYSIRVMVFMSTVLHKMYKMIKMFKMYKMDKMLDLQDAQDEQD